jgi:CubicO group peptidase (beta-lactamase class C family)
MVRFVSRREIEMQTRRRALSFVLTGLLLQSIAAQSPGSARDWPLSAPAGVGLDPNVLAAFDADLAAGKYGYVDSMLVIRHGQTAYERMYRHDYDRIYGQEARTRGPLNAHDPSGPYNYFNPWWHPTYRRGDLHTMQSVTKTVTSVVIGIAIGRREFLSIDTAVLDFFDAAQVANVDERKRRMTVRHLLTMTSGLDWNEDLPYADPNNAASVMEASFDWVGFTIDRPMAQDPGTIFRYSSGATQLLSHVFRSATGRDIEEYAAQHLFGPLGIDHYFWKRSPTGLVDTEGGLYLAPRDLAKIAYLYLKSGVWEGRQIVPADWVRASISPSVTVSDAGVKYGYKWWLYPYGKEQRYAFGGSGFGGQYPIVLPELDLVIVFTGWNVLPDRPRLTPRVAIDRVLEAVVGS